MVKNSKYFVFSVLYTSHKATGYSYCLLGFSSFEDEENCDADAYVECVQFVLFVYKKSWNYVVCLISDNSDTKKSIATKVALYIVGCHSQKFNLLCEASSKITQL